MTEPITLTLPEDIAARVRQIAETTSRPVEDIVLDHLKSLTVQLPPLPLADQAELDALHQLSDDALWTIAREQVSDEAQARAAVLMPKNTHGTITAAETAELDRLVQRADQVMLRKAEAAAILNERGHTVTPKDLRSQDE